MDFLNVVFHVDDSGCICSDLHRKPTATNSLLKASSAHPRHLIYNMPVGQFLRVRKICSRDDFFEHRAQELGERFRERGYPPDCIQRAYNRAKNTQRTELMVQKTKRKNNSQSSNQVRYITPYNCRGQQMRAALGKYWSILQADDCIRDYVSPHPSITFKRAPNLKDALVHSHHMGMTPKRVFGSKGTKWGCKPCGSCVACVNIESTTTFWNFDHTREYNITHTISCSTKNVVYFAICPCGLIYIGLTSRELRRRTREHVLGIIAAKDVEDITSLKPIPRHFRMAHNCDAKSLRVWGIDRILSNLRGGNIKKILAQREAQWIFKLDTVSPRGLNEHLSYAPFL